MADVDEAIDPQQPPSGTGCADCLASSPTGWWLHLRRCATCGHVGCCDSSPSRHAKHHHDQTGHPAVQSYEPAETWFYDYTTSEFFNGPELAPPHAHPPTQPVPGPKGAVPTDWRTHLR